LLIWLKNAICDCLIELIIIDYILWKTLTNGCLFVNLEWRFLANMVCLVDLVGIVHIGSSLLTHLRLGTSTVLLRESSRLRLNKLLLLLLLQLKLFLWIYHGKGLLFGHVLLNILLVYYVFYGFIYLNCVWNLSHSDLSISSWRSGSTYDWLLGRNRIVILHDSFVGRHVLVLNCFLVIKAIECNSLPFVFWCGWTVVVR
jgi:hypothetical protein